MKPKSSYKLCALLGKCHAEKAAGVKVQSLRPSRSICAFEIRELAFRAPSKFLPPIPRSDQTTSPFPIEFPAKLTKGRRRLCKQQEPKINSRTFANSPGLGQSEAKMRPPEERKTILLILDRLLISPSECDARGGEEKWSRKSIVLPSRSAFPSS